MKSQQKTEIKYQLHYYNKWTKAYAIIAPKFAIDLVIKLLEVDKEKAIEILVPKLNSQIWLKRRIQVKQYLFWWTKIEIESEIEPKTESTIDGIKIETTRKYFSKFTI